jgi:transposase
VATKRIRMRSIREILRLRHETGLSFRQIARACGVGMGTVSGYVHRAEEVGLGWPLAEEMDDGVLEGRLFPAAPGGAAREQPDWGWVHRELRRPGVTLLQLWLEYAEGKEGAYRYSRFCEIYRRWSRKLHPSMRQVHRAGEKAFVDFAGKRPRYVDPASGEEVEAELFVGVLGASSRIYARAVASQELPLWIEAHVGMFEEWGGAPGVLVPDNLKSGVTRASRYEPEVNRTYGEMAAYYGAVVVPARPGRPRDKAKAEVGVLCAERAILGGLRNQTFIGLAALNEEGIARQVEWLNNRPMKRLGKSRMELFEELDRPALHPLPACRYEMAVWKVCRVNIDYHIEVEWNFGSSGE